MVNIPDFTDINNIMVIGRKRSEKIRGTVNNIIEEDRILFHEPFNLEVRDDFINGYSIGENTCLFDFNVLKSKNDCCQTTIESGISRLKSGGEPCFENHWGRNCTVAFNIWQECSADANYCIDYNGAGCIGDLFIGSDCYIAMLMSHCWNELMR